MAYWAEPRPYNSRQAAWPCSWADLGSCWCPATMPSRPFLSPLSPALLTQVYELAQVPSKLATKAYSGLSFSFDVFFFPSNISTSWLCLLEAIFPTVDWLFTSPFPKGCLYKEKSCFTFSAFRPLWLGPALFHFITFFFFLPSPSHGWLQRKWMLLSFPKFPKRRLSILP